MAGTPVSAAIVHRLPGRIRLRLSGKRGDAEYFSMLIEDFSGLIGVQHVKANALTGSVVIEFSGEQEALIEQLRRHALAIEDVQEAPAGTAHVQREIGIDPFLLVSGRNINMMFMIGTLLAAVGIVQSLRGRIAGPALPMLWSAVEAFCRVRQNGR